MPWDHGDWGGPGDWGGGWDRPPMPPGPGGQQPRRIIQMVEPVAQHGLRELQRGVNPMHVMREVAAAGYLVGTGFTANQAVQMVEQWEHMGFFP